MGFIPYDNISQGLNWISHDELQASDFKAMLFFL